MEVANSDNAAAGGGDERGRVPGDDDRSPGCRRGAAGEGATVSVLPARTDDRRRGARAGNGRRAQPQPERKDGHVAAGGSGSVYVAASRPGELESREDVSVCVRTL